MTLLRQSLVRCKLRTGALTSALLLALSACGEFAPPRDDSCVGMIGGGSYCLQPSSTLAPFAAQQKVDANFRGHHETLIVDIENDADGLRFVALTPFGQKLLQLSYDNHTTNAAKLPGIKTDSRLSPAMLVALLQITLWPAEAVRRGLAAPLTLEENAGRRILANAGVPILSIEYRGAGAPWQLMHLNIPQLGIDIDVETLPEMSREQ